MSRKLDSLLYKSFPMIFSILDKKDIGVYDLFNELLIVLAIFRTKKNSPGEK